jgi:hypothetical protein
MGLNIPEVGLRSEIKEIAPDPIKGAQSPLINLIYYL